MFDHVALQARDLALARSFYEPALAVLGFGEPHDAGDFFEWEDLAVGVLDDRPATRNLHVGLAAPSREHVDEFRRTLTEAGFDSDGTNVLDPDGNSVEAVPSERLPGGRCVHHISFRVRDVSASRAFYETIGVPLGYRVTGEGPGRASFGGAGVGGFRVAAADEDRSMERPLTENFHLAFAAPDRTTVDEFHRVAVGAGYRDNGPPGERDYHPGYYAAFVLDPDGINVEAVFHG